MHTHACTHVRMRGGVRYSPWLNMRMRTSVICICMYCIVLYTFCACQHEEEKKNRGVGVFIMCIRDNMMLRDSVERERENYRLVVYNDRGARKKKKTQRITARHRESERGKKKEERKQRRYPPKCRIVPSCFGDISARRIQLCLVGSLVGWGVCVCGEPCTGRPHSGV